MDQWISANKAKKIFGIDDNFLQKMESEGKVRTMLAMGNKKLYLMSSFKEAVQQQKNPISIQITNLVNKFFSWFSRKGF